MSDIIFDIFKDEEKLQALAAKYSAAVPRYTSYPTAVEFSESVQGAQWQEELSREFAEDRKSGIAFYVHIPFCTHHCFFCACNKTAVRAPEQIDDYLRAVRKEIDLYHKLLGSELPVEQIHFGGGSPNVLYPEQLQYLHRAILNSFPNLMADAEVSLEADPRTLSGSFLRTMASLGFNRLSIGVQDFSPEVQKAINREQSFELTQSCCRQAREFGLENINIDLIYGLPLQTVESFSRTLDLTLALSPDRIALYGYAHVTWLRPGQSVLEKHHLPSPELRLALFHMALRKLLAAGYCYIGLDHFALPADSLTKALANGKLSRTFMGYTTHKGSRLIALGSSSISILPGIMVQNAREPEIYQEALKNGWAIKRGVICNRNDRLRAAVIQALLCQSEVDIKRINTEWSITFADYFKESLSSLKKMADDALLEITSEKIRLTALGRFFARCAASAFDDYLSKKRLESKTVFSQAV